MDNQMSAVPVTGKLPIEVFGTDLDGHQFIEQTQTLSITRDGATIPLANKLASESELIVRNPATSQESLARVVDLVQDAVFVHVYGIAFLDPSVNLWQIEFPDRQSKQPIILECGSCHRVDAVSLSDIETEILESKQSVARHCECSNTSTVWKRTDRRVTERRAVEREADDRRKKTSAAQEAASRAPSERRRQKRTAMKISACIRCYGGEEVVECEDVSRGGFRFKSQTEYPDGTPIMAAVLYTKSSGDMFVAGRIVFHQKLDGGFHRHGVAYLDSGKKA
jgi:hypothetical protein